MVGVLVEAVHVTPSPPHRRVGVRSLFLEEHAVTQLLRSPKLVPVFDETRFERARASGDRHASLRRRRGPLGAGPIARRA